MEKYKTYSFVLVLFFFTVILFSGCTNITGTKISPDAKMDLSTGSNGSSASSENFGQEIQNQFQNKNYSKSLELLNASLSKDLNNVTLLNEKGVVLMMIGDEYAKSGSSTHEAYETYNQAAFYFDKALDIDPTNAEALNDKGVLEHLKFQNLQRSIYWFDQAISKDPFYAPPLVNKGFVLLSQRDYGIGNNNAEKTEEAKKCFDTAAKLDPNCSSAWVGKALTCAEGSDFRLYMENAWKLNPNKNETPSLTHLIYGNYNIVKGDPIPRSATGTYMIENNGNWERVN